MEVGLANLLQAIGAALSFICDILIILIFVRALLSWVNPDPSNPIVQFVERSTEWLLAPLRAWVPAWKIGMDISPIIAFLILKFFVQMFLVRTLIAYSLKIG